ncbi:hypothetical protein OENI_20225 [Oenococcus oeni]|uniref:hypothetical protein n=1 Tax=Oenococcus oeni TaxID=1247 RepID=UPI0010BB997D|nr:hypothetical protein [Oenococcus oeni]SYW12252.1 hypothetical protein OENI_20225 [Oenococcus oeni]
MTYVFATSFNFSELLPTVITVLASVILTIFFTHRDSREKIETDKMMQLHKESNWRAGVSDLAKKDPVRKRDIISLRSFVRPISDPAKDDTDEAIILFTQLHESQRKLAADDAEEFRLLAMMLLRDDWEQQIRNPRWNQFSHRFGRWMMLQIADMNHIPFFVHKELSQIQTSHSI